MINGFVWTSLVPQNSVVYHNFPFFVEDTAVGLTCVTFMLVAGARPTNLTLTSMLGETRPQATRLPWLRRFVPTSAAKKNAKKHGHSTAVLLTNPGVATKFNLSLGVGSSGGTCARWLIIFNLDISWSNQPKFSFATWRMLLCVHSCGEHALIWLNYRN